MNGSKKILAAQLILCMLAGMLVGCKGGGKPNNSGAESSKAAPSESSKAAESSKQEEAESKEEPESGFDELAGVYPIEGGYTLSYWVPIASASLNYITDYSENIAYQKRAEVTGVDVTFVHPPVGSEKENFNLMISGGEYTDLIEQGLNYYAEGYDAGIEKGVFIRMNELIEKYAPAYLAIVNSDEYIRKQVYTDNGNMIGMAMMTTDYTDQGGKNLTVSKENPWLGVWWNPTYMEACGITEVPDTVPEWTEAFKAFKEYDPECTPLLFWGNYGNKGYDPTNGAVFTAFGIAPTFYQDDDGHVQYGFWREEYKDYLKLMHSWYEAGYIPADFSTIDGTTAKTIWLNGKAGCFWSDGTANQLVMINAGMPRWEPGVNPTLNEGDPPVKWGYSTTGVYTSYSGIITSACENPDIAVRWLDWGYTEDGYYCMNFGRSDGPVSEEGATIMTPTYTGFNEEGECQYTSLYTDNAFALWDSYNQVIRRHNGPHLKSDRRSNPRRMMENLEVARELWDSLTPYHTQKLPNITLTAEEGKESSAIMADVETYVAEMTTGFINGTYDIDAKFDEYMAKIEGMNIKRALEVREAALARYNAR